MAGNVELQAPVDRVIDRHRAEAHEVREDRDWAEVPVDPVGVANLAMAVAVGGVGELEGDERVVAGLVDRRASIEQLAHQLRAHELGQELLRITHW